MRAPTGPCAERQSGRYCYVSERAEVLLRRRLENGMRKPGSAGTLDGPESRLYGQHLPYRPYRGNTWFMQVNRRLTLSDGGLQYLRSGCRVVRNVTLRVS